MLKNVRFGWGFDSTGALNIKHFYVHNTSSKLECLSPPVISITDYKTEFYKNEAHYWTPPEGCLMEPHPKLLGPGESD